jgi:hypothetical protein
MRQYARTKLEAYRYVSTMLADVRIDAASA